MATTARQTELPSGTRVRVEPLPGNEGEPALKETLDAPVILDLSVIWNGAAVPMVALRD